MSQVDENAPLHFNHEVTFYAGADDHARSVLPFIQEGIDLHEPVMVALLPERIDVLRTALGASASQVDFVNMAEIGANPACIIPEWRRFLRDNGALGPVRGVGEPAWPGRRDVEFAETDLHESLLNLAFDEGPVWRLLCPYDYTALSPEILEEALRNHPVVHDGLGGLLAYAESGNARLAFATGLPGAPPAALHIDFDAADLTLLRGIVRRWVEASGLGVDAGDDLVLAAHEVATNSVLHGGGHGAMLVWEGADSLVVEVRDDGCIGDPLVGRGFPDLLPQNGRGIWMANRLCDLVQVRSGPDGTQVRLHAWI
jgi:anti-sigma regulatory factor (Ser/Thr protein kinase)